MDDLSEEEINGLVTSKSFGDSILEFPRERERAHLSAKDKDDTASWSRVILAVGVCEDSRSNPALEDLRETGGESANSFTLQKEELSTKESSSKRTS